MSAIIRIEHLTRIFDVSKPWLNRLIERAPRALLTAVSDVSFEIEENSVYALVGESGSGKSTIGKIIVGLVPPSQGSVLIEGVDLATESDAAKIDAVRADIQMIFQDPYASLNPRWRVRDIIAEPVAARGGATTGLAEKLLEQVGLSAADAGKYPHEFSGGQRQRICIARALASGPKIIVCDEPTSALDVSVQSQVLNLMSDLREELGLTYLFISHDLTVVHHMADRIGVLYLGRLVEEAPRDTLFADPKHPYTQMLFDAAPRMDAFGREVDPPKGEIPDAINPPSGCAFHPRCPLAIDRCSRERPEMRRLGDTRVACHLAE
ncbi:peptide/nickel transport system ATP-binding protein [Roseovarius litoreus]|jgi:peptide/nickel transport system ATP-binding protein|uniref:Peptide/nickel transport system ATP-binding protein n=1 Tax=Roseovarius litoreus TaxID=1155722 RepID=A0A1M7FQ24_9RHOB|nr:oligopeptide/dipeptide ABC transporter ATP-binding protein [Roseovarius litoreus]SHM05789.1 peptide/nickel transport system ATP-binding protein [Roseovarius litoreus]